MPNHRKNIKFTLLTLFFFFLCLALGYWQLSRAHEKKQLMASFKKNETQAPLTAGDLIHLKQPYFHHIELKGRFFEQHFLLDNKVYRGKVGYEVYTPFLITQTNQVILVDRGFVPGHPDRKILPHIESIPDQVQLQGMLVPPPRYAHWGEMFDPTTTHNPWRIEYIDLPKLANSISADLLPYVLTIQTEGTNFTASFETTTITPARHYGYAFQWFALAATLLLLLWAFNRSEK